MIIGINALTHTAQTAPTFFTLSVFHSSNSPHLFYSLCLTHKHTAQTAQARKTQIGLVWFFFKCTIKQFYLLSTNKSQIQHFIQQMQNNNPTPQIKQLQQFTQQFHMAKIYNNNDHSILRHITQIMSLGNPLQSNTTWKSSAIFYPFYVTRVIFDSLFVIKNPLQL